jgi:hypothetical protein
MILGSLGLGTWIRFTCRSLGEVLRRDVPDIDQNNKGVSVRTGL